MTIKREQLESCFTISFTMSVLSTSFGRKKGVHRFGSYQYVHSEVNVFTREVFWWSERLWNIKWVRPESGRESARHIPVNRDGYLLLPYMMSRGYAKNNDCFWISCLASQVWGVTYLLLLVSLFYYRSILSITN